MIGQILNGRYLIEERIGSGGMAEVYRGIDLNTERTVAIKVLREEFIHDEEFIKRFHREARAAAALSNQYLVGVHDLGDEEGIQYIVMDYVRGVTLKELIRENGALPVETVIRFGVQLCEGLDHAHQEHIIHRDIKPQNIIIDEEGRAKLTDFGIARATTSQTVTVIDGSVMGSVHYFSPEQAKGELAEEQSDIYSMGVVLYEMATGQLPFDGDSPVTIALQHLQEPPKDPRAINPEVPPALCEVIAKAMAKDKLERYENSAKMLLDLERVLIEPQGGYVRHREIRPDDPTRLVPITHLEEERRPEEPAAPDEDDPPPTRQDVEEYPQSASDEDGDTEQNRSGRGWTILAIVLVVLAFVGVIWFVWTLIDRLTGADYVYMPDVINRTEDVARNALLDLGIYPVVEHDFSGEYPKGVVFDQTPIAKTQVEPRSSATIVVSKGPAQVPTPYVMYMTEQEAVATIEINGLVPEIRRAESTRPRGTVFDQEPRQGELLENGDMVTIYISQPPVTRMMPYVMEKTLEEAMQAIRDAGLEVGDIHAQPASDIEPGIVIRQSPEGGEEVVDGSMVDLWVSETPQPGYRKVLQFDLILPESGGVVRIEQKTANGETKVLMDQYYEGGAVPIDLDLISEETGEHTINIYIDDERVSTERVVFTEEDLVDLAQ